MSNPTPEIAYYSPCLQGSLSMAVLQRICGGTFVTNRASTLKNFQGLYPDVKTKRRYRHFNWLGGHKLLQDARVIFSGASYSDYLPQFSAKKCLLFHGTYGSIPECVFEGFKDFDHLFLIGPRMEEHLLRFNDKYNLEYSVPGYIPFALYPDRTDVNRIAILEKLGLNPKKKTIVYTPSKSTVGTWLHCAEDIARETPDEFNLILRPHPNQALNSNKKDKASFKQVESIVTNRPDCLIDLSVCSLPELECIADLLISDCNSPAEESLFYDCPQLLADAHLSSRAAFRERFESDQQLHPDDIDGYLQLFDCGPNRYADGFEDWGTAIRFAIDNQSQYQATRKKCFTYIFGDKDQSAAERVAETIKGFC